MITIVASSPVLPLIPSATFWTRPRSRQDLEYINLAVNNVTKIQNLQRCESLKKLDLTINFVSKAGLLTVESLQHNIHLEELYLLGNPCSDWPGYRQYVIAKLPHLQKLVSAGLHCMH